MGSWKSGRSQHGGVSRPIAPKKQNKARRPDGHGCQGHQVRHHRPARLLRDAAHLQKRDDQLIFGGPSKIRLQAPSMCRCIAVRAPSGSPTAIASMTARCSRWTMRNCSSGCVTDRMRVRLIENSSGCRMPCSTRPKYGFCEAAAIARWNATSSTNRACAAPGPHPTHRTRAGWRRWAPGAAPRAPPLRPPARSAAHRWSAPRSGSGSARTTLRRSPAPRGCARSCRPPSAPRSPRPP